MLSHFGRAAYGNGIVKDGLILWLDAGNPTSYPGSGTTWTDLSGLGNNGTLTNGPTFNSSNGGSIVFDGSDDYVNSPISKTTIGSTFTLSVWLYCTGAQTNKGIFQIANDLTSAVPWILLQRNSSTAIRWYLGENYRITHTVEDSQYVNLVITFASNSWKAYKNGIADGSYSGAIGTYTGSSTWLGNGYDGYFSGRIPIFQIYSRALSAAEVQQNFNALRGRFGI